MALCTVLLSLNRLLRILTVSSYRSISQHRNHVALPYLNISNTDA